MLFDALGLTALVLATIGVYGVLAGSVTERTREISVRAALGASRADLVSMKRRCQRRSVAGVAMKDRQLARGRSRLAATRKSRSVHVIADDGFGVGRMPSATRGS